MKYLLMLGGLLMASLIVAPTLAMADDHHGERRYYDRSGRDYHYWNDGEDREYRTYLVERHRTYVPFVRVRPRERQEYFTYRHQHGFKVVIH